MRRQPSPSSAAAADGWNAFIRALIIVVVLAHLLLYGSLSSTTEGVTLRNHTSYNVHAVIVPLLISAAGLVGGLRTSMSAWRVFCCTYVALTTGWVWAEHYAWQTLRFTSRHDMFMFVAGRAPQAPWFIAAASLVVYVAIRAMLRRGRGRPGVRARCGYDLRATPDRCPECGSLPEDATRATA